MTYGTSHFISKDAAIRYYKDYEGSYADAKRAVERKLAEGSIHIGPPTRLKPGAKVTVIRGEGRYQVTENPSGGSMKSSNPAIKGRLVRIPLDREGYTKGKYPRYYGVGRPLWRFDSADGDSIEFRADDRKDAIAELKYRLGRRGKANPSSGAMGAYYTIKASDVGKSSITAFGRRWHVADFIGHIGAYDVGKRVYRRGDILQAENDQQMKRRLGQSSNPSRRGYYRVRDMESGGHISDHKGLKAAQAAATKQERRGRTVTIYWVNRDGSYSKVHTTKSNPAVSLAAIDKALRKAGKTATVKITGASAAAVRKLLSMTPAGRRKAKSEAIVRRIMGNPRQANGRSYVRRGVSIPHSHRFKAGDVVYLMGHKAVIKRVGVSDGVDYVWFVRPVDGTLAMSDRNLRQAGYIDEGSL